MAIDNRDFNREYVRPKTKEEAKYEEDQLRHYFGEGLFKKMRFAGGKNGRDAEGKPRFYELGEQGELKDPFADGADLTSKAFLDKVAQNRILMFPDGLKEPVQIQLVGFTLEFSKPLESLPAPKLKEPEKLSGWVTFANWITRGRAYSKEKKAYDEKVSEYQKKLEAWKTNQKTFQDKLAERTPEILKGETERFEKETERREEEARKAELEEKRKEAREQVAKVTGEKPVYKVDRYRNLYQSYCGPTPERREAIVGEGKLITDKEFKCLNSYELPKGENLSGTEITDREFAALSVAFGGDPSISGSFQMKLENDTAQDALFAADETVYSPEENAVRATMAFTESMIDSPDAPRKNMGQVLGKVYEPSRQKVSEAIREYRVEGKNEKLAGIIASGLNFLLHRFEGKGIADERNLTTVALAGELAGLLDRDEKLKKAVLSLDDRSKLRGELDEELGKKPQTKRRKLVTEKDLKTAKGYKRMLKLARKNEKARVMLHAESLGAIDPLPEEERRKYIIDRLKYETVAFASQNDVDAVKRNETYKKEYNALQQKVDDANKKYETAMKQYALAMAKQENVAEAQAQVNTALTDVTVRGQRTNTYAALHVGPPDTVTHIGESMKISSLVETHLPSAKMLMSLKGEKLEQALEGNSLFAANSPYMVKPKSEQVVKDKTLQVNRGLENKPVNRGLENKPVNRGLENKPVTAIHSLGG